MSKATKSEPEQPAQIPAGYLCDSQGRLVPESLIKPADKDRNKLVEKLIGKARSEQGRLAKFRNQSVEEVMKFVERAAKRYGASMGGKKGNISLVSFDGNSKVVISNRCKNHLQRTDCDR